VRRKKDRELKVENSVNSWKNPKREPTKANHLGYHVDEKPRTPTARKQPANKHASISWIRQMGLHRHYEGTPPIHKLATIFGNSRNGSAHTQLLNIQRSSLNSAMTSDRRAVCFTSLPRRASTASSGLGLGRGGHMDQRNPGGLNSSWTSLQP
jgi:hypothetical protein